MRKLVIYLILSISTLTYSQQLNFIQVDTTTYNQYLRGEWNQLIESGKTALENDIDYYYLQMRMGFAYFSLQKYRTAINYFKNALKFNNNDPVANEYLYYCYKYSGRLNDAIIQTSSLSNNQRSDMGIDVMRKFVSFGLSLNSSFSNATAIESDILSNISTVQDGLQKTTHSLISPQINYAHKIDKKIIVKHQGSYISKNEFSYAIVNSTEYLSPEQSIKQFDYNLNLEITVSEGLIIKPGIHFLHTSIPLFLETAYGAGAGKNRIPVSELTVLKWVPKIEIEKLTQYFDIGLSYLHHNFNEIATHQLGLHTSIYPLSNLNLYLTTDAYVQFLNYNGIIKKGIILKPLIGFKMHPNLWLEVSGSFPEQFNFYDVRNSVAFNNLEKTSGTLDIYGIVPLNKSGISLFIGYQLRRANSYYFLEETLAYPINKTSYNNHLITGGIKWTI